MNLILWMTITSINMIPENSLPKKYKDIERKIDALEDKLDFAEDSLENKFGIDD